MKIFILHGNNTVKSYDRFRNITEGAKASGAEVLRLEGGTGHDISETLYGSSLFGRKRLIVLERPLKLRKGDFGWIKKNVDSLEGDLLIYHDDFLSKTFLKNFPTTTKIEEFALPRVIFAFLDSFFPGNSTTCLKYLHQLIKSEPIEFVFAILAKHVRDLYRAGEEVTPPYPAWRLGKLRSQAKRFAPRVLFRIINEFSGLDYYAKTSKRNLLSSLDLMILTNLK